MTAAARIETGVSDAMTLARRCLGGRLAWRGAVRGLFGAIDRTFEIASRSYDSDGAFIFDEVLRFPGEEPQRRIWRIEDGLDGLVFDAAHVRMLRPGRIDGDALALDYQLTIGGLAFDYHDRFRVLDDGVIDNVGVAKTFGVTALTIRAQARPMDERAAD